MNDPYGARPPATNGFDLNRPTIIALLYLGGMITGGVTALVGVVLAYVWRGEAAPGSWEQSHYSYLIRTFWGVLVVSVALVILTVLTFGLFALIGWLPAIAIGIWAVVRSVLSLVSAQKQLPLRDPQTLLV